MSEHSTTELLNSGAAAEPTPTIYMFESVTLTEDYYVKIVGSMFKGDVTEEFARLVKKGPALSMLLVLRKLTLHMALLTEALTAKQLYPDATFPDAALRDAVETGQVYEHELLLAYRCTSVLFKSKGVVLAGEKKAKYKCFGKQLKIETPPTTAMSFDEEEEGDYPFFDQWYNTLYDLRGEAQYFLEGNYGDGTEQLSLFGQEPEALPESHPAAGLEALAKDLNVSITVSSSVAGRRATRTFNGRELDGE